MCAAVLSGSVPAPHLELPLCLQTKAPWKITALRQLRSPSTGMRVRAYIRGPRGRERGKEGIQESSTGWSSALLKAVTDQVLNGCRFWPMYIFSHSFCNNKGGQSQEKKLGVSMKKRGLTPQDLFVLHTKQTGSRLQGVTLHHKMYTGQIQQNRD